MKKFFSILIFGLWIASLIPISGHSQLTPLYEWKVMQTDHFRIIFHPETEGLAAEAAVAAEAAYQRWATELNTTPPPMTDIVVIAYDDSPNGFADSNNLTSWEYASQTQFGVPRGARIPSNMARVVTHEYWHIADINHVSGISEILRNVFGRTSMPNRIKPWFNIEGSATYSEYLAYGYSRASAALLRMYMQQLALDNDFPSFEKAANRFSNMGWPSSGTLAYIMGSWFYRYVEETYGRGILAQINALNATHWLSALSLLLEDLIEERLGVGFFVGPDFDALMSKATGASQKALFEGFEQWLRDQALTHLARVQAEGPTTSLKLTDYGYWTAQPKWSPDGTWIAYRHSDTFRRSGLRLIHPDGAADHALTSAIIIFDNGYNWSPDSAQIIYSGYDQYGAYENVNDLYLYDLDADKTQRLTWGEHAFNPVYTPDGQSILYAQSPGGDRTPRIVRMNLTTGGVDIIREFSENEFVDFFSLSPDGEQLVLSMWQRPGNSDLYLMSLSDGELVPLTHDMNEDFRPVWSPDGEYILFDSIRDETFNLHAVRVSDGQFFRISNVVSGAFSPTVSPDGAYIAFVGYSGAGFDLHRMNYDPTTWKSVDFPQENIPAWEGFPSLDYEVRPYTPWETMLPKAWMPLINETQIGGSTSAWDALYRHYYSIEAGYDWEQESPFGTLVYINEEHLSPVGLTLASGLTPFGNWESLSLSYSPIDQIFLQHGLSARLQRSNFGGEAYTVSGGWSYFERFGKGLYWNDVRLSVSDALNYNVENDAWRLDMTVNLRNYTHLPIVDVKGAHQIASKLTLGWSDLEGRYRLGGTRGSFMVRGQPRGVLRGNYIAAASLEYRYPILSIERSWGLRPLFLDDVRATVFLDAGTAADEFHLAVLERNLTVGYGAEAQLSFTTGYFWQRSVTFGFAYGLGQSEPELYMSFGSSF